MWNDNVTNLFLCSRMSRRSHYQCQTLRVRNDNYYLKIVCFSVTTNYEIIIHTMFIVMLCVINFRFDEYCCCVECLEKSVYHIVIKYFVISSTLTRSRVDHIFRSKRIIILLSRNNIREFCQILYRRTVEFFIGPLMMSNRIYYLNNISNKALTLKLS